MLKILNVFNKLSLKQVSEKPKPFLENRSTVFEFRVLRLKVQHFRTKLSSQKAVLRQIEWGVQNGPITKNRVLPLITLFFWKLNFSIRASNKKLIECTNYPKIRINTFCKRLSFIWGYIFPVSTLKMFKQMFYAQGWKLYCEKDLFLVLKIGTC